MVMAAIVLTMPSIGVMKINSWSFNNAAGKDISVTKMMDYFSIRLKHADLIQTVFPEATLTDGPSLTVTLRTVFLSAFMLNEANQIESFALTFKNIDIKQE
jgi:hypothetical protein